MAGSPITPHLLQVGAQPPCNRAPKLQRGPARRVGLAAVVGFHNLRIVLVPEHTRGLLREREQQVYTHAEVGGAKHGGDRGEAFKSLQQIRIEAGGTHDQRTPGEGVPVLIEQCGKQRRGAEVDHDVGAAENFRSGVQRASPDPTGKLQVGIRRNQARQHRPHAPVGTGKRDAEPFAQPSPASAMARRSSS